MNAHQQAATQAKLAKPAEIENTPMGDLLPWMFADNYEHACDESQALIEYAQWSDLACEGGFRWPRGLEPFEDGTEHEPKVVWTLYEHETFHRWIRVSSSTAFVLVSASIEGYLIQRGWHHERSHDPRCGERYGWFHSSHGFKDMDEALQLAVTRESVSLKVVYFDTRELGRYLNKADMKPDAPDLVRVLIPEGCDRDDLAVRHEAMSVIKKAVYATPAEQGLEEGGAA